MKFEIFEKRYATDYLETKYLTIPAVKVVSSFIRINNATAKLLQLKKGSEIIFSKSEGSIYIANVTDHYKTGFVLNKMKKRSTLLTQSTTLVTKIGLVSGYYELEPFPVYDKFEKIDWHKLTPIK